MADTLARIIAIINDLPVVTAQDLADADDSCPICLVSFKSILQDSDPNAGVTKLEACNHLFCRKDLAQWIESQHGSCPTCRHTFLDIRPPSESDDESSDGGEYIPNEHEDDFDDEDEEGFIDTDGFSDAIEYASEPMELDIAWDHEGQSSDADIEDADMEEEELGSSGMDWEFSEEDSTFSEGEEAIPGDGRVGVGRWPQRALEMGVDIHGYDGSDEETQDLEQGEPK